MNVVTFNRLEVYYYIYIFIGINFSPGFVLNHTLPKKDKLVIKVDYMAAIYTVVNDIV